MPIDKIAIIGLGLIGGSLAKAIKHSNPDIQIGAFDLDEILESAVKEKVIDSKLSNYFDALDYDLIILSLPIEESIGVFEQLSPKLKKAQIISDVCSVKGVFSERWKKLKSNGNYFGAHPMAGKEQGGYKNSDSLLFENSVYIVSNEFADNKLMSSYTEIIKLTGARITFLNPYLHDKIVSKVSHLPQLLAVLLVNQAAKNENGIQFLDFGAGGFRDMTRIAASDFKIWESIINHNKSEIIKSLSSFRESVDKYISFINDENYDSLAKEFSKARTSREEIPFSTKGFLSPLYDITIFVEDKPGMILKFSSILSENNINIKDLELLKIREGSGGNFKLYFETESDALKAKALLEQSGFKTN